MSAFKENHPKNHPGFVVLITLGVILFYE